MQIGYPDEWLSHTFSLMTFGNGVAAIVAGLIASAVCRAVVIALVVSHPLCASPACQFD